MLSSNLVARVFHEDSFKDKNTRISAKAAVLSAEYIRLFIREAVLRANNQRMSEGLAIIDGIDNVQADESTSENNDQFDMDHSFDDDRGLGVPTQVPPSTEGNDTLATRHLAAVSGLLVMDF